MPDNLQRQTWQVVDYFAMNAYIEEHMGRAWSLGQNGGFGQDEMVLFEVSPDPEATAIVNEWLASPPAQIPGRLDQPGVAESVHITTDEILNELCNRGLLDEGDLRVHVWW